MYTYITCPSSTQLLFLDDMFIECIGLAYDYYEQTIASLGHPRQNLTSLNQDKSSRKTTFHIASFPVLAACTRYPTAHATHQYWVKDKVAIYIRFFCDNVQKLCCFTHLLTTSPRFTAENILYFLTLNMRNLKLCPDLENMSTIAFNWVFLTAPFDQVRTFMASS